MSLLRTVYDGRSPALRHVHWLSFSEVRERVEREWKQSPAVWNPISTSLHAKCEETTRLEREHVASNDDSASPTST